MAITDKQIDFISREIELAYSQIDEQRKSTTNFLKIYLSIILAFFAFIYFLENKLIINGTRIHLPTDGFLIFGMFGLLICFVTFIIGWALLDNVTKTVYKSIKYYKHISYLRSIISATFENGELAANSILQFKLIKVPMRISGQVPIIGGIINFILLLLSYYFLILFVDYKIAILITTLILTSICIFYSNQLEKHFEEILIAQKLRPGRDEITIQEAVKEFIKLRKKSKNYVRTKKIYTCTLIGVYTSSIIFLTNIIWSFLGISHNIIIFIPCILFVGSIIPRIYMGRHRLEKIKCFD